MTDILFALLILCIILYLLYKLYVSRKLNILSKKYRQCMKKGDNVKIIEYNNTIGKIIDFDEQDVIVEVKINRNLLYPNKNEI